MGPSHLRVTLLFLAISLEFTSPVQAQTVAAITDAASYAPRVAPGSLATIFGTGLAASSAGASSTPLQTNLNGTTVEVNGSPVPLVYVSDTQIDFQVPYALTAGQSSLVVTTASGTSSSATFDVISSAPAIFQYGTNQAVAQNAGSAHTVNGSSSPAAVGSVITVYLTGQGAVSNPVGDGDATPSSPLSTATATASATIGPQNAPVKFLGLAPGFVGLAQANIQIPTLPTGAYPLVITIGGYQSASAMVSVSGSGTFTSPLSFVSSVSFANSATSSVAFLDNIVYICGPDRIQMVNVSNPAQPSLVGEFGDSALGGYGTKCAINTSTTNPFLVDIVADLGSATPVAVSFAVFDLTDPTSPNLVGVTATTYSDVVNLSFSSLYGYSTTNYITYDIGSNDVVAQNGDLLVFSFSTPADPAFAGILTPNSAEPASSDLSLKPYAAVVGPTTIYIATTTATGSDTAGEGALTVVDISDPILPTPLAQLSALPGQYPAEFRYFRHYPPGGWKHGGPAQSRYAGF